MCSQSIAFWWKKILFKQSNGLISVIQTLLYRTKWLRGCMLTLNTVIQTQMVLNTQVTQIGQFSWKRPKSSTNDHKLKFNKIAEGLKISEGSVLTFGMKICQWESCVQSGCCVCSQSIKNNNVSTIPSIFCNCFNGTKRTLCVNMKQWMKHRSTTSLWSQIGSQLSERQHCESHPKQPDANISR